MFTPLHQLPESIRKQFLVHSSARQAQLLWHHEHFQIFILSRHLSGVKTHDNLRNQVQGYIGDAARSKLKPQFLNGVKSCSNRVSSCSIIIEKNFVMHWASFSFCPTFDNATFFCEFCKVLHSNYEILMIARCSSRHDSAILSMLPFQ